jgi:hypothetical protein
MDVHEMPHAPVQVTTYGWLMRQDPPEQKDLKSGVSLAGEWMEDATLRDYSFILNELIVDITEVRIPKTNGKVKKAPSVKLDSSDEVALPEASH